MLGISSTTGKALDDVEHLAQSIRDILTTPVGSRVIRRDYGSDLPRLVDAPLNNRTILALYAATASAIKRWEPRFQVTKVSISDTSSGSIVLDLVGNYLPDGQVITISGIKVK